MIPKIRISEPDTEPRIGPDLGSTEPVSQYITTLIRTDRQTQGRERRGEEPDVMRRAGGGALADEKNMITVSFVDGSNHSE